MEWLKEVVDYGVVWILVALSVLSLGIAIERNMIYKKIAIEDFPDKKSLELELTRKLHLIATIGSNAPYLGLLGKVLGIILTFYTLRQCIAECVIPSELHIFAASLYFEGADKSGKKDHRKHSHKNQQIEIIAHDYVDWIDIRIFEPQPGDTTGAVPYANVRVAKYFWGNLEVIASDTTGGSPQRIRFSKRFGMLGVINSVFEKVGFDYNTRRGWRFMQISDAVFTTLGQTRPPPPPTIEIQAADTLIRVNPAVKLLRFIPQFAPGDSVTVNIHPIDTTSVVSIRYPSGMGYATQLPRREPGGVYRAGFSFPRHEEFGHFLVDVINPLVLSDSTSSYFPNAIGVLYRAR